jgi:DNA-directed RNA polymerase subunit RPC12/RpoP
MGEHPNQYQCPKCKKRFPIEEESHNTICRLRDMYEGGGALSQMMGMQRVLRETGNPDEPKAKIGCPYCKYIGLAETFYI